MLNTSPAPQLTAGGGGVVPVPLLVAEQLTELPPLLPLQNQENGPEPETAEAVPVLQRPVVGGELNEPHADVPQVPFTGAVVVSGVILHWNNSIFVEA